MRKKTKTSPLALLLLAASSMFFSCGNHDFAEDDIKWDDDNGGTLEVMNGSNKDMVLFIGQVPRQEDIMGGVRAGKSKKYDIASHVSDFTVGGYAIVRGITRDEYNEKKFDLANAKWEFNSMVTYKAGQQYRINIDLSYTGNYAVRLTNKAKVGLELRKNSPQGEKVAYLPALGVNQMLYTQTTESITLFPVYVFYNGTTQEVSTLYTDDLDQSVTVSPRSATDAKGILTYVFPFNGDDAWERIKKQLKSPVAYIKVANNMEGQSVYFTNAGSSWLYSQEGFDAVGPGETLVFEVKSEDWDEDTQTGGKRLNLQATYAGGTKQIYVLKEGEDSSPLIKNGYNYVVTIDLDKTSGKYFATIEEREKRNLEDQITSL